MSGTRLEGLPAGVDSVRELIRNYMVVDSKLTTPQLKQKIKQDYNLDVNHKTVSSGRYNWLLANGLTVRTPRPKPNNVPSVDRSVFGQQVSTAAVVRDIMSQNPRMTLLELKQQIASKGISTSKGAIKTAWHNYVRWNGIKNSVNPSTVVNTNTQSVSGVNIESLKEFRNAVKNIGGAKVALTILSLFEEN